MKNSTIVFILFLFNIALSSKVALEYKLQQKNGKNFLVINTDGDSKKSKKQKHHKKQMRRRKRKLQTKVYKNKKIKNKRKLGFTDQLQENAIWALTNLGSGAIAGAVSGKAHKSKFLKQKLKFQRDLNQIKMKTEVQKENLADLFKVKLALKRALSKLKAYKSDLVFRLRAKEDDIVELLGETQV